MKQILIKGVFFMIIILSIILFTFGCNEKRDKEFLMDKVIGVKIYDHKGEFSELFKEWKQIGINTVFCSVELYSNAEFRSLAKKNGITSFIIVPIFYDPDALITDPGLFAITDKGSEAKDDWVEFVCPSRENFRIQKVENVRSLVKELNPDGISIDFIRHFVFWEKVFPDAKIDDLPNTCFDSSCLHNFQSNTGIMLPDSVSTPVEASDWIHNHHLEEWTSWKCRLITSMVDEIINEAKKVKPDIKTNAHIVPWRQDDYSKAIRTVAGQDISKISKHVDFLSPMCYSHMVKRGPGWVHSVVKDIYQQFGPNILPSIQVKEAYLKDTLGLEEFRKNLQEALKPPSKGVIFWSWEQFDEDLEKKDIIRSVLENYIEK